MSTTHYGNASYVRAKAHRRAQSKRHRRRVKFGNKKNIIRAAANLRISPNSVASLKVDGYFEGDIDKDWLVKKSLLANDDNSFFAVPNVLFSSSNPVVPIMNPTDKPRYIRKGETIGMITDPTGFLDTPKSEQHWESMSKSAMSIAALISCLADEDTSVQAFFSTKEGDSSETQTGFEPATATQDPEEETEGDRQRDHNQWDFKTAEMPV